MTKEYYSDFTEQNYSKTEFLALLTKRIKKDLRNEGPLDMNITYCLYENGVLTKLVVKVLTQIFENRLKLIIVPKKTKKLNGVTFLDDAYLEKYVSKKIAVFFEKKELTALKNEEIFLLRTITFKELNQLKGILGLKGSLENETQEFIEKLNNKYSQTKASILKSFNHIAKLL